jgi:hypothetical protein
MAKNWTGLDQAFAELEAEVTEIVRGITVEIFNHTLHMSPQRFGKYVSSWTYDVGAPRPWSNPQFDYITEDKGEVALKRKGDREAIDAAVAHNAGHEMQYKLGDVVYISNGVVGDDGNYAALIEEEPEWLRDVNKPGRPLGRSIDRAGVWYAHTVNPKRAPALRALRIA